MVQVVKGIAPGMAVKVSNTDEFIYLDVSHALLTSCLTTYREWLVRTWLLGAVWARVTVDTVDSMITVWHAHRQSAAAHTAVPHCRQSQPIARAC